MTETWKPIPSLPSYEASDAGNIRKFFKRSIHVLKPFDNGRGYAVVKVGEKGKMKSTVVHKLIMETFLGPRPEGMVINHKDGNKRNNRIENLEYVTAQENRAHAVRNFLMAWGERHSRAKLISDQVLEIINLVRSGKPRKEISSLFGISVNQISDIVLRKTWAHLEI